MRILVIGASGTIGKEVVALLGRSHEVVRAARSGGDVTVDIRDVASLRSALDGVKPLDAIVSAAGSGAWKPLAELSDDDFARSLGYKLMGQVNVIRYGFEALRDGGSITVTSGILAANPMQGSAAISLVNSGLEGFARAAALEAPRGIRVNVVSPPWVSETLVEMGQDPSGGLPSATVARTYAESVEGTMTGQILVPRG
jgi:NAD(P)-dependent dehydrogenase (short-subunit alcohol dehydrogenase family)